MRPIPAGHEFTMRLRVDRSMTATFFGQTIHDVYATFAIVEHAEYASRQAIRSWLDPGEDAVGSRVEMRHRSPAPVGAIVTIVARVTRVEGRSIDCDVEIAWNGRAIASGVVEQIVLERERLQSRFEEIRALAAHENEATVDMKSEER